MTIKKVWIEPGCIVCHRSSDNCPEVFYFPDGSETTAVRPGADFAKHDAAIREAAEGCPVQVIKFSE